MGVFSFALSWFVAPTREITSDALDLGQSSWSGFRHHGTVCDSCQPRSRGLFPSSCCLPCPAFDGASNNNISRKKQECLFCFHTVSPLHRFLTPFWMVSKCLSLIRCFFVLLSSGSHLSFALQTHFEQPFMFLARFATKKEKETPP